MRSTWLMLWNALLVISTKSNEHNNNDNGNLLGDVFQVLNLPKTIDQLLTPHDKMTEAHVTSDMYSEDKTTTKSSKNETTVEDCIPSLTLVKGKRKCKNHLIFNEMFQSIRRNYWTVDQRIAGAPDYEFVVYVDRPETIEISKGITISIKPALTEDVFGPEIYTNGIDFGKSCTGLPSSQECQMKPDSGFMLPPIASAQINTKNKFSFIYGSMEIRAKLPAGDWIYPILYLSPEREEYGKYYESGQIRLAFIEGNVDNNKMLRGGIVLGDNIKARKYGMKNITSTKSWSNVFHKYQLKWTPESITVGVDDVQYGIINPPKKGFVSLMDELGLKNSKDWENGSPLAPFDKEMYLQVGVGVGGFNFEDRSDGTKPWRNGERHQTKRFYQTRRKWLESWKDDKNTLIVDYIKIWAL